MNRKRFWIAVILAVAFTAAVAGLAWTRFHAAAVPSNLATGSSPRAAIIDQVALTHPNPQFTALASAMLEVAGYQVDVFSGDQVTVEFYKDLATHGYRLILLRTHSSDVDATGEIGLFTSELYREDRWVMEQLRGRLAYGHMLVDVGGPDYFAVVAAFIREEMRGRFDDAPSDGTVLIISGCKSLSSPKLARAFLDRGASAVIGWDDTVDLTHNDRATLRLLLGLVGQDMTIEEAVQRTMMEIGPDPVYGSWLVTYTK